MLQCTFLFAHFLSRLSLGECNITDSDTEPAHTRCDRPHRFIWPVHSLLALLVVSTFKSGFSNRSDANVSRSISFLLPYYPFLSFFSCHVSVLQLSQPFVPRSLYCLPFTIPFFHLSFLSDSVAYVFSSSLLLLSKGIDSSTEGYSLHMFS